MTCFTQGDGSAAILQDDGHVFTFSMHCGINFPFNKQQSDLDISLDKGVGVRLHINRPNLIC